MALNQDRSELSSLAGGPFSTTNDFALIGKKETRGPFYKWLPRQHNKSKLKALQRKDELTGTKLGEIGVSSDGDEQILPCPYIRPLKNKLVARVECTSLARRPVPDSTSPLARKEDGLPRAKSNWRSPSEIGEEARTTTVASDAICLQNLRLRENIAAAAAADPSHLKEWGYYIKCYSEGCFNLILPPGPPPMKQTFTYLPSTYPPNEAERLALFQSSDIWSGIDIVWSPLQAERARGLIKTATAGFAAPWSSVSFFDLDNEIVQAERGYSRHLIPRRQSIASHVLLTNEVMAVLDAQKDWRFAGNPLVKEYPKIRFYAGAPLLSSNGEVVGVFSIFSPEPRDCFTAIQRRDLTRFSETALQELMSPTKATSEESILNTIVPQPSSASSGASRLGILSSAITPIDVLKIPHPHPPTLWYHKASQNSKTTSRVFIDIQKQKALTDPTESTPPHSNDSDTGPFSLSVQYNSSKKNPQDLTLDTAINQPRHILDTPDSPTFGYLPNFGYPRPEAISSSSPNSVDYEARVCSPHSQHLNTPSLSSDYSGNGLDAFSFDETALLLPPPQSLPSIEREVSNEKPTALDKSVSFSGHSKLSGQSFDASAPFFSPLKYGEPIEGNIKATPYQGWDNRARTESHINCEALWEGRKHFDPYTEAKFATEFWAGQLGFDIMYAVELVPRKLFMTDLELQHPGGIETRVLVSYGLHEGIDFDIAMHLNVLRGSGGMIWENREGKPEDFKRGFMMPLPFDFGVLEYRSKGVVFGAFRKKAANSTNLPELDSADIRRLRKAARGLKRILHRIPTLRRPSYSMAEPHQTPTRKAYQANEAAQMAKHW